MPDNAAIARDYHERTAHRPDGYARGPEALDWSSQPDPFRRFDGASLIPLPLAGGESKASYAALFSPGGVAPQALNLQNIATLFELSLGISAWKGYMGDRWALRCNPSSGNLHPTEGYAVCCDIPGIENGVYHYRPDEHALEQRASVAFESGQPRLIVGLSSILWREGWKYGERAFRYCMLDGGHAQAAFAYAAATLGWHINVLNHHGTQRIATLLGLDDVQSFRRGEREIAELLFEAGPFMQSPDIPEAWFTKASAACWSGMANRLDPAPYGRWPILDEVAAATQSQTSARREAAPVGRTGPCPLPESHPGDVPAWQLIRQRRSAQRFDPRPMLPLANFLRMLDATLPRPGVPPFADNPDDTHIDLVLFVHRVEGLRQGLYALLRSGQSLQILRSELRLSFEWAPVQTGMTHLPLYMLIRADCRNAARTLCCQQAIAGDACFAVAMLGEFDAALDAHAGNYRRLFNEAGIIGQALYLEAENAGFRGTGIGCYFDPAVHDTLGISGTALQSMYHFAVGMPLVDERIETLPPYEHLKERRHAAS
ncbi:MAG: nitroreductase [Zetaproteobacteria bacterium CG06_land_8_20_14_3_00_59_53]|nr:MAG: hypothetical protein AUK36_05625 [Zetaproteobacteria bacterium CG2_30_59_37]PIO90534.1 MAG: nitroreductase [Zetaproteobacteria bacterium CG23_combo_of_CG06-09_8_20_14_all_59_86]PIQ66003.1 MAG: nitroreductase [Zetaproteobacteria bacterium CG11_big_fil_rev_8_21_14_0_20_59_439]PIU71483.1 MAG: nitroreductase [Zetaproteobacteria bacterium CG06_land_8_20_14_3_00_59_53]PIU97741.1 MAG: nitroreductase [Zetaproteobacteria bacterium CG03_land_8_20_14_0_80_59_51]PIY47310.1 MAG: nitroreductase [Zet